MFKRRKKEGTQTEMRKTDKNLSEQDGKSQ